ncbi:MAG: alpha/beta hydrolase [Bosea sp.]|uniref:alpha/beta fold hydrolase n=1 Tax=Bosea sp. (in: a-proteobacteria) TaxID=1871050 RepID=UPI001AD18F99|nr:alpha/beta hydrolase [Bosea sp. (in: a-proteobacteria)]MBN9451270.1 alpha/beta hydrolase [Bosea sp. (in: a-proteobacteria)]
MNDPVFRSDTDAVEVMREYRAVLDRWPVPKQEIEVLTSQGATFVLACGPETAPPVVLLHGAQANSAAWLPDIALWSNRFRLYAVDMIGEAGLSARVRPPLISDTYATWLEDVFTGLGLADAALVGTSLGGWLALDYAMQRPSRVSALALICPAGIGRQKNFLLAVAPYLLLGAWGKRKILEKVFGPPPKHLPVDLEAISPLMERIGRAIKPRVIRIPRLSDAALDALAMPLLAIVGGRDALIDSYDTRLRLERHVPNAEVCFIEKGYHFLPDQSQQVFDFLVRNLQGDAQTRHGSKSCGASDE